MLNYIHTMKQAYGEFFSAFFRKQRKSRVCHVGLHRRTLYCKVKNIQLDSRDLNIGPENKFQKF